MSTVYPDTFEKQENNIADWNAEDVDSYRRRHSLLPLIITGIGCAIRCTDAATVKSQLKKV